MRITCRTNLDLHHGEQWPTLDHVPQIGAKIESLCNRGTKSMPRYLLLKVIDVTYRTVNPAAFDYKETEKTFCEVELGIANGLSIYDWQKWYKTLYWQPS